MKLLTKLFIFSLLIICPTFTLADNSFPSFPMAFWGTVTINGSPAAVGTVVRAYYDSVLAGTVTIQESGIYGYTESTKQKLIVGEGVGGLKFTIQSASFGDGSETTGNSIISYSGFSSGLTIQKNLNFTLSNNQIVPNANGIVTVTSSTPQVVITNPTQAVTINVGSGINNGSINYGSLISGGTGTIPQTIIDSTSADIVIPASTIITSADTTWNGVIATPTVVTVTLPETSGQTKTLSTAIEVGFTGAKLSFDKAVRILFPNQAGKRAGYVRTGITFTEITNICAIDNQTTGNALTVDGDCKIDVGSDLIIWTKHFTSFATYTQTTNNTGGSGGGGGGGGGYTPPTTTTTKKGDTNKDGKIDKYDFALMMSDWGKLGVSACDFNNDNKVDKYDFALLMSNWGL